MKKWRLVFIYILISLLVLEPILTVNVMAKEKDGNTISDIGNKIEQYVKEHADTTVGMSVAVFDENETIYRNYFGYMDVQNEIPVTEDTVMEWGSVSKLLVWISVMQLVEQEKIDLEVDVSTYLPEGFLHNRAYDKPITMLNLMNHNAGFEDSIIGMATGKEERIISLEEYLLKFQPKQVFEPGTVCAYSNWSTTLAAYIVECVSGIPYYKYVRINIFEPLEMKDTSICANLSDNLSVKERRMELKIYTTDVNEITPNMSYIVMYPAGMCISTIEDMQKFAQSLLSENTILFNDKETYHELFSPSLYYDGTEIPRNYHGFWPMESYETRIIGHNGNTAGCSSSLLLDIENQVGIVIQTNQANEQIYNISMPEVLFGKYDGYVLDYTGLIMCARTIFQGPLKLQRLFSVTNVEKEDAVAASYIRTNENGIEKLSLPFCDFLVIGVKDIALDIIVLGLYLLSLIYCLINIVRYLIKGFVSRIKGKIENNKMELWCVAGSLIPFVPLAILIFVIPSLSNLQQWSILSYRIAVFLIFICVLVILMLIIYGVTKLKDNNMKKSRKIYMHSVNVCLIITLINIIYWNWCMFWMI